MFVKVTGFHWQGLVGPAIAVIGAALLIAVCSILLYSRSVRARGEGDPGEAGALKRMTAFGVLLILVGAAAYAVLGGGRQILSERFEFTTPTKTEVGRIYYQPLTENLTVPLREMIRKGGARVMKEPDRIDITRNVFVETPFIVLGSVGCVLEFTASGTEAEGEGSKILVGVLELKESGTSLVGTHSIYELTPEAKVFRIPVRLAPGKIGAVRVDFLNALNMKKKGVRVASISDVAFRRQ